MTDPTFAAALTPEQLALTDDELRRQGLPVPSPRERDRLIEQDRRRQRAALQQAELAQDAERPRSRFGDPKAPEPHTLPTWARRQLEQQAVSAPEAPPAPQPQISKVIVWQNGMVMTFDQAGQQLPEFQGHRDDVLPLIRHVYAGPIEGEHDGGVEWSLGAVDEVIATGGSALNTTAENCPAKPDSGEEGRPARAVQESPGREGLTSQRRRRKGASS